MSGRQKILGSPVALATGFAIYVIAALVLFAPSSDAAQIKTCDQAIAALNKQLPLIAKRKIQLRVASATRNNSKIAKARYRYATARKIANGHRSKIRKLCTTSSVKSLNTACLQKIETYSESNTTLATRRYELRRVTGNSNRAKKKRKTLKTKIRKLTTKVRTDSKTFQNACTDASVGSSGGPSGGTTTPNPYKDPVTTVACTPAQYAAPRGCQIGVPSINIPSFPGGLNAGYQITIDGEANGICSLDGLALSYSLMILVDDTIVSSASSVNGVQTDCNSPSIDLQTTIAGLTLSPATSHRISLRLKTSVLLPNIPYSSGGSMTADIAQL